jgi:hypothetical protein
MTAPHKRTLQTSNYDDLRDSLSTSGIFDMTDCSIQIWCPEESTTDEIERMVRLIESMVHVTDIQVGSRVEDLVSNTYSIVITEVPHGLKKKYLR